MTAQTAHPDQCGSCDARWRTGRAGRSEPQDRALYEHVGLLPAAERASNGYRVHGDGDVERMGFIKAAQRLGMRLDEIAEVLALREADQRPCGYVRGVLSEHVADIDNRIPNCSAYVGNRWTWTHTGDPAPSLD